MHFTPLLALASSAALIAAAPAPAPISIGVDDVILHGKGRFTVMKRSDFEELEAARKSGVVPPKPAYLDENHYSGNDTESTDQKHVKRATSIIIPNPNSRFLGWDVQISQVTRGAPTTIAVASGYSISNTISVGTSSTLTLVKDFLQVSMSVDYSRTWQTTQTQTFTAEVPKDKYGAFVSNPWTTRASGNVWTGSIGGNGELSYYQADSFESKQFGIMEWVDGVISLCTGDEFPLKRCLGGGTL
ncbi:hypothetical protein G6011_05782 [Alternaria panax]|uniref:Celp0028 effector like protein n=1 Tax=Alternaria panax TaxID=48097 RepID=A0AAD4FE16_9PLEO|nr:hypothetical protein G6011_05782 [Alternaria panax]